MLPLRLHSIFSDTGTAIHFVFVSVENIISEMLMMFADVGKFCEVDLNECESEPCFNGGTCVDRPGYFVCICVEGFGGVTCQRAGITPAYN